MTLKMTEYPLSAKKPAGFCQVKNFSSDVLENHETKMGAKRGILQCKQGSYVIQSGVGRLPVPQLVLKRSPLCCSIRLTGKIGAFFNDYLEQLARGRN